MPRLECSRALLLPGPQPPLSHFGATLLRHTLTTGIRYALHSLGAPMPARAPVRFIDLRLYLDRDKLAETLSRVPAADALLAAWLEPGGAGRLPADSGAVRGAATFHRWRLRLRFARRPRRVPSTPASSSSADLLRHFQATLAAFQPALNDALLGELLASLDRRAERARQRRPPFCLGRQAHALYSGTAADLESLGILDPLAAAWSEVPDVRERLAGRREEIERVAGAPAAHPLRGEFREAFRRALNRIRAAYLELAAAARRRGLLEEVGDAFFIPFDLAEELAGDRTPAWLPRAVTTNRLEYQQLLDADSPPESIESTAERPGLRDHENRMLAPLWPLA